MARICPVYDRHYDLRVDKAEVNRVFMALMGILLGAPLGALIGFFVVLPILERI